MAVYGTQSSANERNTRAGRGIPSRGNGPLGLTLALSRALVCDVAQLVKLPGLASVPNPRPAWVRERARWEGKSSESASESGDIGWNAGWELTPPTDRSAYPVPTAITEPRPYPVPTPEIT